MKKYIAIFLVLVHTSISAQIITTFAGGGTSGLGDGGPATAATIPDPEGGVFDAYGNYYCAENIGGEVIRKVDTAGIISIIAGIYGTSGFSGDNGPATLAEFYEPTAVKIDAMGNIFICDEANNRIRKIDVTTGIITTFAGSSTTPGYGGDNGPATAALLFYPEDICFDKTGNLYIADGENFRVRKVDTSGIITTIAGKDTGGYSGDGGPATDAKISLTIGLAIDDTGNIYI